MALASACGLFWLSMVAAVAMFVIDTVLAVDTYKTWQAIKPETKNARQSGGRLKSASGEIQP